MSKRKLSSDERRLWQRVTNDVYRRAPDPKLLETEAPEPVPSMTPVQKPHKPALPSQQPGSASDHQSIFEAVDPQRARRVQRGRLDIDATLDLHGLSQEEAFTALQQFFMTARTKGHRVLLIITGKGIREDRKNIFAYSAPGGILRHRFLQWAEGPFRQYIAGVRQSHQRHGGSGAFYVFMKKRDRGQVRRK